MQMQTYGLALWVPYFGTSAGSLDPYTLRSEITPAIGIGPDPNVKGELLQRQLKLLAQWREIAGFYYGDFYPLTEYSEDESTWMAWQWASVDGKAGVVQVFRRPQSSFEQAAFRLRNINEKAIYEVENLDSPQKLRISGEDLAKRGIPVIIHDVPGAIVLKYSEKPH